MSTHYLWFKTIFTLNYAIWLVDVACSFFILRLSISVAVNTLSKLQFRLIGSTLVIINIYSEMKFFLCWQSTFNLTKQINKRYHTFTLHRSCCLCCVFFFIALTINLLCGFYHLCFWLALNKQQQLFWFLHIYTHDFNS